MKIALTGASGLVGSRFFDLLKSKYEIIPMSSSYGVDITDKNKVHKFLLSKSPTLIVHMAAKTNVDLCEEDYREDSKKLKKEEILDKGEIIFEGLGTEDWKGSRSAFGINVVGTKILSDYARKAEIPMIYMSTDFVFDGEKSGEYTEEDSTNPINWYGQTKLWGEKVLPEESLIARISYPYGYRSQVKRDFVWGLLDILKKEDIARLICDQIITPTFVDDIIMALDLLIERKYLGLLNIVGNNFLSPYEIGVVISREFGLPEIKIDTTTREELYKGRARRPFKIMLKNDKLRALGFEMTDFFEALRKIRQE
jgi:dTDP-4-dehydrorhamnose reductase